jgi:hypothetical protein
MANESYFKSKINQELKKLDYQFVSTDVAAAATGKKPYDGLLVRNGKCMAVEYKRDYRKLEDHQKLSLIKIDAPAIIIRVFQDRKVKAKEIVVTYPSGSIVFTTPLKYKVFARMFNLTFGVHFIDSGKLAKYNVHNKGVKKNEIKK